MLLHCFRPLPGDLISQYAITARPTQKVIEFPSPSRGSYFSIGKQNSLSMVLDVMFPSPSRGSYFSIAIDNPELLEV